MVPYFFLQINFYIKKHLLVLSIRIKRDLTEFCSKKKKLMLTSIPITKIVDFGVNEFRFTRRVPLKCLWFQVDLRFCVVFYVVWGY